MPLQAPTSEPFKSDFCHAAAATLSDGSPSQIVGIQTTMLPLKSLESEMQLDKTPAALFFASVSAVSNGQHHEYVISITNPLKETTSVTKRYSEFKELYTKCKEEIPSVQKFFASHLSMADKEVKREHKRKSMDEFLNVVLARRTMSMELQSRVQLFLEMQPDIKLFPDSELCEGWLIKNAIKGLLKGANWTKRLFVLQESTLALRYFHDTDQNNAKLIQLYPDDIVRTDQSSDALDYNFCFRIERNNAGKDGGNWCVQLCAKSEQDRKNWIERIQSACVSDHFSSKFVLCFV
jgi:hypothetical protein